MHTMRRASSPKRKDPQPPRTNNTRDKAKDAAAASPITPAVTGIFFPSPIETTPDRGARNPIAREDPNAFAAMNNSLSSSNDSAEPITPPDAESIDQLWNNIREQKGIKLAKEPSKIKSFEARSFEGSNSEVLVSNHLVSPPAPQVPERPAPPPREESSVARFVESPDGRTITATFDLPGLTKEDIHISFHRDRIDIIWEMVEFAERIEEGQLVRERVEKTHNRTIPIPERSKFKDVKATMYKGRLTLTYPNINRPPVERRTND